MTPGPRWHRLLLSPRLPLGLAALAFVLGAPSLGGGLHMDDHVLKAALASDPPDPDWGRSPSTLFAFFKDEAAVRRAIERGQVPWWTSPGLRLAFFRPLAGWTHWMDFRLWPDHPWLMHLQSLVWFAAAVAAAASLYRRLLGGPNLAAGLAALAFALDDAHASPAVWLANRNALLGGLFGLLALIAHDRWRRDRFAPGAWLSPAALALALLGGEIALAACAYLLAYAVFLDRGSWRARLASLVPTALVGGAWALAYRAFGYGAHGSSMYVDPAGAPALFARALAERAPLLLMGQWGIPSHLPLVLSEQAARLVWLFACGVSVFVIGLLAPLVRRDPVARFFALGMMLSLVPACSTFPHDRLLFLAGFGGAGLLAQLLVGLRGETLRLPGTGTWTGPARLVAGLLVGLHFVLAPAMLLRGTDDLRLLGDVIDLASRSLPAAPEVEGQDVFVVQTPSAFVSIQGVPARVSSWPRSSRLLVLGSGLGAFLVERPDPNVLVVRPQGGFLLPRGRAWSGSEAAPPPLDPRYLLSLFDGLFRESPQMSLGALVAVGGLTAEIAALTADGRPAEVRFTFERPLDDPSYRWLRWDGGVYAPFGVPPVGQAVTLPPVTVPFGQ